MIEQKNKILVNVFCYQNGFTYPVMCQKKMNNSRK